MGQLDVGSWVSCTITVATSNTVSAACDLGREYSLLEIILPTITAAQISLQTCNVSGGTYQDLYMTNPNDGTSMQIISDSGTGGITWFAPIGGWRYIKIKSSAAQAADRVFTVRGANP